MKNKISNLEHKKLDKDLIMKIKKIYSIMRSALLLLIIIPACNAAHCIFDLPPGEQMFVNGNQNESKLLKCQVETSAQDSPNLLNFVSEVNTSVINNLILPEGTIMSLAFAFLDEDRLTVELKEKARLAITNDTNEFIKLYCVQS